MPVSTADIAPLAPRFPAVRITDIVRYWAGVAPHLPAVWEQGAAVTFASLQELIDAGQALLAANGVVDGDRVMIVAENCVAEIAMFFAASELCAWPVIVNARIAEREIAVIRGHCRPRVSVFTSGVSAAAAAHAARASAQPLSGGCFTGLAIGPVDASVTPERDEWAQQVATVIYTSGTTGSPKGVMVTHRGLLHFCGVSSSSRNLLPSDRVYAALPLSHIFGIATVVLATLYAGASIYLETAFAPERAIDALEAGEISILQGVPTMFRRLLTYLKEHPSTAGFPRLRYLYTGGGPLDAALKAQVEEVFGLPLHHGYGMTEYAGSMFVTSIDRPRRDCSAGLLNPECSVRIVDSNGFDVASGSVGELWVRGPGTMLGYYRAPEITREVLRDDGWLNTGDTGRLEPDGALFVIGRTKDLIKRSGFNVHPIEVEAVLNSVAGIKSSAVVGQPLPDGDEEVVAFLEMEPGAVFDPAVIAALIKPELAPYKRPGRFVRVELMPVNANGKILKHRLKALLEGIGDQK